MWDRRQRHYRSNSIFDKSNQKTHEAKIKFEYEPKRDIVNIEFLKDVEIEESVEEDGIIFDYSKDKRLVSVEVLDARKRVGKNPLDKVDFSVIKDKVIAVWILFIVKTKAR